MTIVLNSVDNKGEAVDLGKVALGDLDFLFLRLVGVLGLLCLAFFALFILIRCLLLNDFCLLLGALLLVEELHGLTKEVAGARVNELVLFGGG